LVYDYARTVIALKLIVIKPVIALLEESMKTEKFLVTIAGNVLPTGGK